MRRVLILLVLAACGGASKSPAWPERAEPEEDGGESLEPHAGAVAVEASSEKGTVETAIADILEAAVSITPATPTPPEATPPATDPEEVIITEEITIEIEE